MFDTMGLSGNSLIVSFGDSLWIFAVSQNLPSAEPFAPAKCKWKTLKTLTKRAYDVCSNQELLQKELNYIEKVFRANSNYPN